VESLADDAPGNRRMKQWLPAVAGMACLGLGPGLIGVYGFFTEYLADEFDVGVATINIGPVALLLVPGIAAPFIGRLVDRMDIRRIILCGSALAMVSLLAASQAPSLWMAGLAFLCFSAGLALYGPVVVNGLLVKLYEGREARALAIAAIGISFSSAVLPPVVASLLAAMDWRSALASLASFVLIALWLAVLAAIPPGVHASVAARPHRDGAGGAFYRDRNFWLIGLCMALWMNVAMVLTICYPPHFIAQGLSMEQAGWLISLAGASGLIGKALLAMIADSLRRHAKWLAAGILGMQVVGLSLLGPADTMTRMVPVVLLLGMSLGAFLPMHSYLNSRYFSADVIGRVTGAQMPLFLPLGLIGPPLAGFLFDRNGDYLTVLPGLALVLVLAILFVMALPVPRE